MIQDTQHDPAAIITGLTYLQLFRFALFIVLEFFHVLLELLALVLSILLLLLGRLYGILELSNRLLRLLDVGSDLSRCETRVGQGMINTHPCGIASANLLLEQAHLVLLDLEITRKPLPLLPTTPRAHILLFKHLQSTLRLSEPALGVEEFLDLDEGSITCGRRAAAQRARWIVDIAIQRHRPCTFDLRSKCHEFRRRCVVTDKGVAEDKRHGICDIMFVSDE